MLVLIILWVVCAFGVGSYASTRGRSGLAWFGVALLVSPLICVVILTVAPDLSSAEGAERPATVIGEAIAAEVLGRARRVEPASLMTEIAATSLAAGRARDDGWLRPTRRKRA